MSGIWLIDWIDVNQKTVSISSYKAILRAALLHSPFHLCKYSELFCVGTMGRADIHCYRFAFSKYLISVFSGLKIQYDHLPGFYGIKKKLKKNEKLRDAEWWTPNKQMNFLMTVMLSECFSWFKNRSVSYIHAFIVPWSAIHIQQVQMFCWILKFGELFWQTWFALSARSMHGFEFSMTAPCRRNTNTCLWSSYPGTFGYMYK